MAYDANIYKTNNATAGYVNPVVYDEEAIKYMYDMEVVRPLGIQDTRMLEKPGKQFNKVIEGGWTASALTEGTITPVSAYVVSQKTVTFAGYGDSKQFSLEELNYGFDFIVNNAKYNALGALSVNRENVIVTELMTTSTTAKYVNNRANDAAIISTDVLNGATLVEVDVAMMQTQARGCSSVVIHPKAFGDLRKDTNFIDYSKNPVTAGSILRTGEVGSYGYQGIKVFVSNRIQYTATGSGGINVYKNIALGKNQPFVYMQKRTPEFRWGEENIRERAVTFHYWEMFGTEVLVDASVQVVNSA
jgi:N4-gp56 family major capsid protein